MKVKRFNNLWTMGLILTGAILVLFYIAKIFFPEFIVGVAEIPSIVKFGNYVDSHKWAYYLYAFLVAYIGLYIHCCACCRKIFLSLKDNIILIAFIIAMLLIQRFCIVIYAPYNYAMFVFLPFLISFLNKNIQKEIFISTVVSFSIDIMAQGLSIFIRDIVIMASWINSATLTILLVDTWIWRILLYLFFNYKTKKESE